MKTLTIFCAALLVSGFAQAQSTSPDAAVPAGQAKARFEARFAKADSDKDGKLTRDEAKAGMPRVYQHFDEIDTAKQGYVSESQIGAFMAAHAKSGKRGAGPTQASGA